MRTSPYREWPTAERQAVGEVDGRVLDVGCGAGRVALHLQEQGHDVVAIDESPLAVEVARRRGVRDARVLALGDVDATLGTFDTILLARNNFGLEGSEAEAPAVLRRLIGLTSGRRQDRHRRSFIRRATATDIAAIASASASVCTPRPGFAT